MVECPYCDAGHMNHTGSSDIEDNEEFDVMDFFQCLTCGSVVEGYRYNKNYKEEWERKHGTT